MQRFSPQKSNPEAIEADLEADCLNVFLHPRLEVSVSELSVSGTPNGAIFGGEDEEADGDPLLAIAGLDSVLGALVLVVADGL